VKLRTVRTRLGIAAIVIAYAIEGASSKAAMPAINAGIVGSEHD